MPHLAFLFLFLGTPPHIVDRAANDLSPLIFFEMLIDELVLLAGLKAHGFSLFASGELLLTHTVIH